MTNEHRQWGEPPSRMEHDDLKARVTIVEGKLDRITWLVIATLVTAILDLFKAIHP